MAKRWRKENEVEDTEEMKFEKTPLEIFKECFNSNYKLIENVDEFNNYLYSTLDCDTWCRKKLYNKMKELGLGDEFINQFADLVGDNLYRYHKMIDLASEITDKHLLLETYKCHFNPNKSLDDWIETEFNEAVKLGYYDNKYRGIII